MTSNRRGFTLLETIVAMALASAGLAAVYQVYASAANAERAANEAHAAVQHFEALRLDAEPGDGQSEDFTWSISTRPAPGFEGLEEVHIRLTATSGRDYELRFDRAARQGGQ
jgi:prepilin-type N-terminal cleavage/methylation domain-containing protein